MAKAKKCDRCGAYFDTKTEKSSMDRILCNLSLPADFLKSINRVYGNEYGETFDLCPCCVRSFKRWMKMKSAKGEHNV